MNTNPIYDNELRERAKQRLGRIITDADVRAQARLEAKTAKPKKTLKAAIWVKCTGEAHRNIFIDHCGLCMPWWEDVPKCPDCGHTLRDNRTDDGFNMGEPMRLWCRWCRRHYDAGRDHGVDESAMGHDGFLREDPEPDIEKALEAFNDFQAWQADPEEGGSNEQLLR